MIEFEEMLTNDPYSFNINDIVVRGNTKLGRSIYTFSLPAIITCPGSTETCRDLCYACKTKSIFNSSTVQTRYWKNYIFSQRSDFAEVMINTLKKLGINYFRWHVSGDIYSIKYALNICLIIKNTPSIKHTIYTRSWREEDVESILFRISDLKNINLWYSCDRDTGYPVCIPPGVRLCYLQVKHNDIPDYKVDLFFRDHQLQDVVIKNINGTLVCPVENGITQTTCDKCKVCYEPVKQTDNNRISLPVLNFTSRRG